MSVPFVDIHTHHPVCTEGVISVQSLFLQDIDTSKSLPYQFSAGIHPWHADQFMPDEIRSMLKNFIDHPGLIAIGETGLDKRCHVDIDLQKNVFDLHIEFAEKIQKPLIIHCVNSWNEIISLSKKSTVPFILHGYRGNTQLTRQLIRHGFCFSIGKGIIADNIKLKESVQIIPSTSLFLETDDAVLDIKEIYYTSTSILKCSVEDLKQQIFDNYNRVFLNSCENASF